MHENITALVISGIHSGPDPSPGLGVARSVRASHPQMRLIGKDYSLRSSGLHDQIFDEIQLMPAWSEMSLSAHHSFIQESLIEKRALYISGLDAEIDWLSSLKPGISQILNPSHTALLQIQKPKIACAAALGMNIPDFVPATATQMDLHALARRSGWKIWIKGKFHEAYPASSHREMMNRLSQMQLSWPIEDIFVQQNISGLERSYTFAAYNGKLLGVAEVEKRSQTSAGKTWTAEVAVPSNSVVERIAELALATQWTGGCEIEFIRSRDGRDWLIDVNPRFPAYIFGVTINGLNLPGILVDAAIGRSISIQKAFGGQFTRVVNEIQVRKNLAVPAVVNAETSVASAQKHPSFQPSLVSKRRKHEVKSAGQSVNFQDRSSIALDTPSAIVRARNSPDYSIDGLLTSIDKFIIDNSTRLRITPALSIKTDPQGFMARAYLARGWYAEAISKAEIEWAKSAGFGPHQIVVNGPAAASIVIVAEPTVRYVFADSTKSLAAISSSTAKSALGLRIRPSKVQSRFGIDLTDYYSYISVLDTLSALGKGGRFGVHMHLPADQIGPSLWLDCFDELITWAISMKMETGIKLSAIDIGGGWHQDDLVDTFLPILRDKVIPRVLELGPDVELIFEPGKAISTESARLFATITEVREYAQIDGTEVVLNCSIADLPMTQHYAHRIEHHRNSKLLGQLTGGKDRILGSICMETDILAVSVAFPVFPEVGDLIVFRGAGGYNSSMAWPFAGGVTRD